MLKTFSNIFGRPISIFLKNIWWFLFHSSEYVCDNNQHCEDNSDELNCQNIVEFEVFYYVDLKLCF